MGGGRKESKGVSRNHSVGGRRSSKAGVGGGRGESTGAKPPQTKALGEEDEGDAEDKDKDEKEAAAAQDETESKLDPLTVLHTGDLVLIRCRMPGVEGPSTIDGEQTEPDQGFLCADSFGTGLHVVPVPGKFAYCGYDPRDFLFVVVQQLSYTAQKDLRRRRKYVEAEISAHHAGSAALSAELREYEKRAKFEAQQNQEITNRKSSGLLKFGAIFQMQHVRSKKFVGIRPKFPAKLNKVARRVELQAGSINCWIRANPAFVHKMQGEPILFNEQVSLECTKLGAGWNFGSARCRSKERDIVHEISCFKGETGFFFMLYSRTVAMDMGSPEPALGFGCVIRLFHAEQNGFITASCNREKTSPYIRRVPLASHQQQHRFCAKDIFVTEHASLDRAAQDCGVEYGQTPVLLRHFGSGRYLAVDQDELMESGIIVDDDMDEFRPLSQSPTNMKGSQRGSHRSSIGGAGGVAEHFTAQLVDTPGPTSVFTLEPTCVWRADNPSIKLLVPRDRANVMVKWAGQSSHRGVTMVLWLGCVGLQKGQRDSLELHWTRERHSRDAVQVQLLDAKHEHEVWECDAIVVRRQMIQSELIPRLLSNRGMESLVQIDLAMSDMIYFLADSVHWGAEEKTQGKQTPGMKKRDALKAGWTSNVQRQRFARELKYVDMTFSLFEEMGTHWPDLVQGPVGYFKRMSLLETEVVPMPSTDDAPIADDLKHVRIRVLKLIVRLWLHSFLGSRENENYFHKNKWLDVIDKLNGQGLGASDVFVALVGNNPPLVREISSTTVNRFIEFIRLLGPLDTWLSFFKVICAPQGLAVPMRQQDLLQKMVFRGHRASEAERSATSKNRRELLVWVRLDEPIGVPLGKCTPGQEPPWEGCLAKGLLSKGVHDIAISWAHPDRWEIGQGVLYHGPKALGLPRLNGGGGRTWTPLHQVVWVLQPERCCEAATGKRWEDIIAEEERDGEAHTPSGRMQSKQGPQHNGRTQSQLLRMLATYFLAQLQLIANIVKARQMNCIMALQEEYSFSLCICGARDTRLPTSIRSAFFEVLACLWLDRHPHSEVVVPNLMRRWTEDSRQADVTWRIHNPLEVPESWSDEHLRSLPEEVHAFYRLGPPGKLEALLQVLRSTLCAGPEQEQQVHSAVDDNGMMLAVLRCLEMLLRFGYFHDGNLLGEFLAPVLRCLDGRTDWLDTSEAGLAAAARAQEEDDVPAVQNEITPLLQGGRMSRTSSRPGNAGGLPPAPDQKLIKARFPPQRGSTLRYLNNDMNAGVVAAKKQMAHVVLHMMQVAVDLRVSRVLREFPRSSPPTPSFVNVVLQVIDDPALALEQERVSSPNVMLIDLLMYEDPALFDRVLELLCASCMRTSDFLSHLGRVKMLRQEHAELAADLRQEMYRLGQLIYSFENWGVEDDFSIVDEEKIGQLKRIHRRVRQVCSEGEAGCSSAEVQDMLRQTEFFSHLKYCLSLEPQDFEASSRPLLNKMVAILCSAATYAIRGNHKNQGLVFAMITQAADLMDDMPEAAVLVTEVFRGNLELCNQVPEVLVVHFGDLIVRERRANRFRPWYLSFFCAIVSVGTVPVPRNQRMVIEAINHLKPNMILRLGEMNAHRLQSLASAFRSEAQLVDPDPSTWSVADGELLYYLRSVELMVGLARGQGSEALTNKPLVNSLYPVIEAIRLLLEFHHPTQQGGSSIHCRMRTKWLQLLHVMLYDVEASLFDEEILGCPVHVEFFAHLLRWIEEALDLIPIDDVDPGAELLDEGADEYTMSLLRCVDSFFQSAFPILKNYELCDHLAKVAEDAPRHFSRIVQQGPGQFVPRRGLRDSEFLCSIALRILSASGTRNKAVSYYSAAMASEACSQVASSARLRSSLMEATQGRWQDMVRMLRDDARVKKRLEQEGEELGQVFLNVSELTDPDMGTYVKHMPSELSGTLPRGVDLRRNRISVEDILRRLVKHTRQPQFGGLDTLRRLLRSLMFMIRVARAKEDPQAGPNLQLQFVKTGVAELVIQVLDANIAEDIEAMSWDLLAETLHAPAKLGTRDLQAGLYAAMRGMDDSGLWESFQELTDVVGGSAKTMRALERLPSLIEDERKRLRKYQVQVRDTCTALRVMRLMAEGHYVDMQDYLFSQVGNSRSVNVLATTFWLMTRLCKDPTDADMADEQEFECLSLMLELLTEVAQGPNLRNQEFLSTLGLIEAVFKVLAASCVQLQKADQDLYPPRVQSLKAQLVETLLALLESRADSTIHLTMVQRVDRQVLRERIQFVYLYFVFGVVGVASGEVQSERHAAIPLDGRTRRLFLHSRDPSELSQEVAKASAVAEELVEDLDDEELDTLFSEGLDCLQVCLELSPHSKQFEEEVMPIVVHKDTFVDKPALHATKNDYVRERKAFHERQVYRMSFEFLQRFVHTIEVSLHSDQLQSLHFQQPLTAMWYCSNASKQRILREVPLSSTDAKTKAFIQMCQEVHRESMLIRQLSRFSIIPDRHQKWAQRNLPDGLHRPFQVFLANDARRMQHLLSIALFLSVALAAHVGINLIPEPGEDGKHGKGHPRAVWSSEAAAYASEVLGGLYFAVTLLWVSLTACLKVPLNNEVYQKSGHSRLKARALAVVGFFRDASQLWRCVLLTFCGLALFGGHNWLYSFLVVDCFCQNSKLATVLSGIVGPAHAWLMTFFGMMLVTFVYAAVGFHYFSVEFGAYCSDNIAVCTLNILYQGTRAGVIGLSNMMDEVSADDPAWGARIMYDVSYFILFGVMLLNAVVALVVDSFSTQRRLAAERDHLLVTETFISGIDRKVIDAAAHAAGIKDGFHYHETYRQNKWDYMSFIFHLAEKSHEDYTGPEQAIGKLLQENDVKWVPNGKSKMLQGDFADNDGITRIQRKMDGVERELRAMGRQRKTLFATLNAMTRAFMDKAAIIDQEATAVKVLVEDLNSRPNMQALASDMSRFQSIGSADT